MKVCRILLLLAFLVVVPVFTLYADDIDCRAAVDPCKPTVNPCGCNQEMPPLQISGPGQPSEGDSYSTSGGRTPYSYSMGSGAIDDNGQITSINGCGDFGDPRWTTVTVTDSCGQTANMVVLLPGGRWGAYKYLRNAGADDCKCSDDLPIFYNPASITRVEGQHQLREARDGYCRNSDAVSSCQSIFGFYAPRYQVSVVTTQEWVCQ